MEKGKKLNKKDHPVGTRLLVKGKSYLIPSELTVTEWSPSEKYAELRHVHGDKHYFWADCEAITVLEVL